MAGNHNAWLIVDADRREDSSNWSLPAFCEQAKIVALNKFTMEQIDTLMKQHMAH